MKFAQLVESSGVSAATLKFWIRAGLLPAGRKRNATTAHYTQDHVARIRLIVFLRERLDVPIASIRHLTALIDAPVPDVLAVLEMSQRIAEGFGLESESVEPEDSRIADVVQELGWPAVPSRARTELARAIRESEEAGLMLTNADLVRIGGAMKSLAQHDVGGALEVTSLDERALFVIRGITSIRRVENAMRALADTSLSIERMAHGSTEAIRG